MPTENLPAFVPEAADQENPLVPVRLEALDAIERSRIDLQLEAARHNPRPPLEVIERRIHERTTRRVEIAELCYYTLPRYDKDTQKTKFIHGASVKLARIALSCWGNTIAGARTVGNDGKIVRAYGICWDLEINNQQFSEVQRRIVDKAGRPYSYDMQIQTAMAANAIAKRNAILDVLGDDISGPTYLACMKVVAGTASDLIDRRDRIMKWFSVRGVKYEQLLQLLEKDAIDKVDQDDVAYLSGVANAIKDKEITMEEAFGAAAEETPGARKGKLRELRDERRAQKAAEAAGKPAEKEDKS